MDGLEEQEESVALKLNGSGQLPTLCSHSESPPGRTIPAGKGVLQVVFQASGLGEQGDTQKAKCGGATDICLSRHVAQGSHCPDVTDHNWCFTRSKC